MKSIFNPNQTIHAILFILKEMGKECGFHQLFKILYFADQKHLVAYGTPITGDLYIAMRNGPVPSIAYDFFKSLREEDSEIATPRTMQNYKAWFDVKDKYKIVPKQDPDLEELAESHLTALKASIQENKGLNFNELTKKSHQSAWEQADMNDEMDLLNIAKEGNADEAMLHYIALNIANQRLFSKCD